MAHAIGLSVGASKLAGVAVGSVAVTRSSVLTRFPHRPPEVGLPSENADLDERGLIITDFVDRVGDPAEIVASDGSSYLAADLLVDALCSLLYAVTRGQAPLDPVGVTYPVHWQPTAIDALRRALTGLPEFGAPRPVVLVPDAVAALMALQDDPGVPADGIIAVCDFGATGTSITLADAGRDFAPISATVRDVDLSGHVIDQALLTHVIADLAAAGSIDLSDPSAVGSLTRLRTQCRGAKERLSTTPVTSVAVELPGRRRGEIRLTRDELHDTLEQPLAGFVDILYEELRRNRIHQGDLVAVASIGGGARMPIITATLSEHLRVPVITTGHPELNAAIGAGLEAQLVNNDEGATSIVPKVTAAPVETRAARSVPTSGLKELGWSGAKRVSDPVRVRDERIDEPRSRLAFDDDIDDSADLHADIDDLHDDGPPVPWYHNPFAVLATGVSLVLAATAAAAVFVLVRDDSPTPTSTTISTSRPTPTTTQPPEESPTESSAVVPPPPPPSPLDTVTEEPPRATYTQAPQAPAAVVPPAAAPSSSASDTPPPPSPSDTSTAPPPPPASPSTEASPAPPPPSSNTPAPEAPVPPAAPAPPAAPPNP